MKTNRAIILMLAVAGMTACKLDEISVDECTTRNEVRFVMDDNETKGGVYTTLGSRWEDGDGIGVFCPETNPASDNTEYIADLTTGKTIFSFSGDGEAPLWNDEDIYHNFIIYYPYKGNVSDKIFKGRLPSEQTIEQRSIIDGDYNLQYAKVSGKRTSDGIIPIREMKRQFGVIEFQIICDDPDELGNKEITKVSYFPSTAIPCGDYSFNLENGALSWTGKTTEEYSVSCNTGTSALTYSDVKNAIRSVYMLVPPGSPVKGSYCVEIDGKPYSVNRDDSRTIEAGDYYTVSFVKDDIGSSLKISIDIPSIDNPIYKSLDYSNFEISKGSCLTLTATVLPADAMDKSVSWSSSDPSIARVTESGVLYAVSQGNAVITATASDGVTTDTCIIKVKSMFRDNKGHEGIQLWEGGPYWATTNIGAEEPHDYGLYFGFGTTTGYDSENLPSSFPRKVYPFDDYKSWYTLTEAEDAAYVNWGANWRVPNRDDLGALTNETNSFSPYTTIKWSTRYGVNGIVITGIGNYSNSSIFIPAAGYATYKIKKAGSEGEYWSSNCNFIFNGDYRSVHTLYGIYFNSNSCSVYNLLFTNRVGETMGCPVRPVHYEKVTYVRVTDIELDKTEAVVYVGEDMQLTATVLPTNATDQGVSWEGDWDDAYCTVSQSGVVHGIKPDSYADITVNTSEGFHKATCRVHILEPAHEGVQLWEGGPYWATTNIGAYQPEEHGQYFSWGNVDGYFPVHGTFIYDFTEANYEYTYGHDLTAGINPGNKNDAARKIWKDGWRIPTYYEFRTLINEDKSGKTDGGVWVEDYNGTGVSGLIVHGTGSYSTRSIFLPAVGQGLDGGLSNDGSSAYYWTSTHGNVSSSYCFELGAAGKHMISKSRYYGMPIRPVYSE